MKRHAIEIKLNRIEQLFNSMDPSPFHERDLDHDAEEFIVNWARELPSKAELTLKIYLHEWPSQDPTAMISSAAHHFFDYRLGMLHMEFKFLMRQARTSLFVGLSFLTLCLITANFLLPYREAVWLHIMRESLTIVGWVAMWRPINMYLYDWWPLHRKIKVFRKLSQMEVQISQS